MEQLKLIFNNSTQPITITFELKILTQSDAQKYAIFIRSFIKTQLQF